MYIIKHITFNRWQNECMKTPLNYTGNKSRLVSEFEKNFPKKINVFVDLFCGGGTVGLSINANKVIFIDNNKNVVILLKHLSKYKYITILTRLEKLIEKYKLSYSAEYGYSIYRKGVEKKDNNGLKRFNFDGFYKLRNDYNKSKNKFSKRSLDMLYLLIMYGFNNDMRFNRNYEYNLPIGKTDLNKNNLTKLKEYIDRVNSIECEFICGDFREEKIRKILFSANFVYADPPYLLGGAVYNENGNWNIEAEERLADLLQALNKENINFALSNVLEKRNPKVENKILKKLLSNRKDLRVVDINYHYRSSSYNKKNRDAREREVLITNFGYAGNL